MNEQTIATLNEINKDFYTRAGTSFSDTRERPWQGWVELLPHLERLLEQKSPLVALDVGCGNARFAEFLASHLPRRAEYVGLDFSPVLLHLARTRLDRIHDRLASGKIVGLDLLGLVDGDRPKGSEAILDRKFNVISAFGLFHHVASQDRRRGLLAFLRDRLDDDGRIAISIWRFLEFERMRKKVISWEDYNARAPSKIELEELEEGDCLLRWGGEKALQRYCHFSSDEEVRGLLADVGLEPVTTFEADGVEGALNRYYLLKRA